jgi:hypothetical protein
LFFVWVIGSTIDKMLSAASEIFGHGKEKGLSRYLLIGALLTVAAAGNAQVLYSTSFEAPTYVAGSPIGGVDGWANGSGTGGSQSVSDVGGATGSQSLYWNNGTGSTGFYSVRRAMPSLSGPQTGYNVSMKLAVQSDTTAGRYYGLYLVSTATSTLGGTTFGITISGDGTVRAGKTWGDTYGTSGIIGQAAAGTFADRWLTVTLDVDKVTNNGVARISGFGAGQSDIFANFTGIGATLGLNIGTDYGPSGATGRAYMDDLSINAVPEPATMAALGLGLAAFARRRRRK